MSTFAPAVRSAAKARIALAGPPGSGKTYTGLTFAHVLGDSIAVIDSERGAASGYAGMNGWAFDVVNPASFAPDSLVDLLAEAAATDHDVILVDSLSHYWMGAGGMLEQVDRASRNGNSFGGWKEARPAERRMIDALLSYPGHVIVTMRTKMEYVVEKDDRGKQVPRKVGLKPEQRDGIEYEFRLVGDLSIDNVLTVSKSAIPALSGLVVPQPGPDLAQTIKDWYEVGPDVPDAMDLRARALSPELGKTALEQLAKEAESHGLGGAAVTDDAGGRVLLLDLIRSRWLELDAAEKRAAEPAPIVDTEDPWATDGLPIEAGKS